MPEKIALITGANGGLGTQVTQAFLNQGATVFGLSPGIKQSDFDYPNFFALPASLSNLEAAKEAVDTVISRHRKIDILAHLVGGFAGDYFFVAVLDHDLVGVGGAGRGGVMGGEGVPGFEEGGEVAELVVG